MRRIEVAIRAVDVGTLKKHTAFDADTGTVVSEPCVLTNQGKPFLVYGIVEGAGVLLSRTEQAVKNISYNVSDRTDGLVSRSRVCGYLPRVTIRRDYCTACSMHSDYPAEHATICEFAKVMAATYRRHFPAIHDQQAERVRTEIRPEWVIPETPFTTGIVNWDNALHYHHDSGNYRDVMSCMVVFRKAIRGGMLSIPELNLKLDLADRSFLIFDGQRFLHGVTPIEKLNKNAYRYSIVFYVLQAMKKCLSAAQECQRIRKVKREREKRRLGGTVADICAE